MSKLTNRLENLYKEHIELNKMNEIDFIREGGKSRREAIEMEIRELEDEFLNVNLDFI